MAGQNSGAMFYFDTNIDAVATDIAGALARINASLAEPLRLNAAGLASNEKLMQGFGRDVSSQMDRRIKEVRSKITSGMNPAEMRAEFQRSVGAFFNDVPNIMANGLGRMPGTAANSAPVKQYAQELAKGYHGAVKTALSASDPAIAEALKGVPFPVAAYNALSKAPVNFANQSDPEAYYRNRLRAEGIIRRDPAYGEASRAKAEGMGFTPEYMKALHKETVTPGPRGGVRFNATDAGDRLKEIRATEEANQKAVAQQAAAERQMEADAKRRETNTRRTASQQTSAQRIDEQRANAQTLLGAGPEVKQVGAYRVLNGEVYKLTQYGAERIRSELVVNETLAKQEQQMARLAAAEARSAAAAELRSLRQNNSNSFTGGFANRFGRGGGTLMGSLGSQIASAASFTVGYGALFGAVGAIKDMQHEFSDYQDSLTDLQVATRNTDVVTNKWVDDLGDLARVTGENVGAALDTAARGVRAFGNPLADSTKQLQDIGLAANSAANQLALVADKPLTDATGDTVAIGTAFGMQPDQLQQIVDAVSNAKRSLGGDSGQISQGLASIATSANEAGFSLNQAADLISLVQARTDESGQAVATRLTKIFQVTSGSTGKSLGKELGVDTTQSTRKQLEDYAKIYTDPNTSKPVRDRITSALGGTANLKELLPILKEGARLQQAYGDAADNAGAGISEFNRKSNNLPGTLKKIHGDIKAIEVDLARTDMAAPFGLLVYTLEPLLHLTNRLLQFFDNLPGPVRGSTSALIDFAIAAKVAGAVATTRAARTATKTAEAAALATQTEAARVAAGAPLLVQTTPATQARIAGNAAATEARNAEAVAIAQATERRIAAEVGMDRVLNALRNARAESESAFVGTVEGAMAERQAAALAEIRGIVTSSEARTVATTRENAMILEETVARAAVTEAETVTAASTGGLAALGRALVNPWMLAVGALLGGAYAINRAMDGVQQRNKFDQTSANTGNSFNRIDGSSVSITKAADDLRAAAGTIKKSDTSTTEAQTNQRENVRALNRQEAQLRDIAKGVTHEEHLNAKDQNSSVFGDGGVITSTTQLANGLNALADAGATATQQMDALRHVLATPTKTPTGEVYQPKELAATIMGDTLGNIRNLLPDTVQVPHVVPKGNQYSTYGSFGDLTVGDKLDTITGDAAYGKIRAANDPKKIDHAVLTEANKLGLHRGDLISPAQKNKLIEAAIAAMDFSSIPKDKKDIANALYRALMSQAGGGNDPFGGLGHLPQNTDPLAAQGFARGKSSRRQILNGNGPLSAGDIKSLLNPETGDGLVAQNQNELNNLPAGDDGSAKLNTLRKQRDFMRTLARRLAKSGDKYPQLAQDVANSEDAYADAKIAQLEDLRRHDQSAVAGNKGKIRSIGQNALNAEIDEAGADTRALKQVIGAADDQSLKLARAHLVRLVQIAAQSGQGEKKAKAALSAFDKTVANTDHAASDSAQMTGSDSAAYISDATTQDTNTAAQNAALRRRAHVNPTNTVGAARGDLGVAVANLAAVKDKLDKKKATQEEYYAAQQDVAEKQQALAQAQVDLSGAMASARAARTGGAIASAKAQLQGAAAAMRLNARHTIGWWQGLQSFYEGQEAMRQAVMEYHNNLDRLHGDITDPVENARDQLRADQRALHAARNKEDRAAARVAIRTDSAGYQDARFQQRLSDWDTDEALGRISYAKHMSLLDHEHDRLTKIHHRTRQQQDELDTVDKAIKDSLNSMDSQFNLGDINTNGLVYQVRRFKAEMAGGGATSKMAAAQATTNQTVTISINGADTAKVKSVIDNYLRIQGGQRQTLTRRKV